MPFIREDHFLNKNGRPHWFNKPSPIKYRDALLSMHFVSQQAERVIKNGKGEDLVKDHTVPIAVLHKLIDELQKPTRLEVKELLLKCYRISVLTKSENQLLKNAGLNSKMPENWDGVNMFARYEFVNIEGRVKC